MMTASPLRRNGSMHGSNSCHPTSDAEWNDTLKNNNQPGTTVPVGKAMATLSWHISSGDAAALAIYLAMLLI